MTEIAQQLQVPVRRPPAASTGVLGWLRANLFNSVFNTILTLIAVYFLVVTIPPSTLMEVIGPDFVHGTRAHVKGVSNNAKPGQ